MTKRTLVVCYSLSNGNTRRIARQVAEALSADFEEIETLQPYSGSYDAIVDQGQQEVNSGYRPKLKPQTYDPRDYDVVVLATPTWWYTMAPVVASYCQEHDWKGRSLVLVQTHGGWPGHTLEDLADACKGATVIGELQVQFDSEGGDHLVSDPSLVEEWIAHLKQQIQ